MPGHHLVWIELSDPYRHHPADTRHSPNAGSMLDQRRRRWSNLKPTLSQCIVLTWHLFIDTAKSGRLQAASVLLQRRRFSRARSKKDFSKRCG